MGLGDLVSKAVFVFKADTSDLKRELRDLRGEEKKHADDLIKNVETQNAAFDKHLQRLAHVGLALDTLGKGYAFVRDAMKSYGEHQRLVTATAGINIDRLSNAFGGLVTQHDLLTMAAQTQRGVLKLNQGEMETLGKAAVAMKNRGFELEDALKKLTDAAVKGKVGGLDDLGLSIKEGASRAETLKNMMEALNGVIAESGGPSNNAADAVDRLSTSWKNAEASMKHYVAAGIMEIPNILDMTSQLFVGDQGPKNLSQSDVFAGFQAAAVDRYKNGNYQERLNRLVAAGMSKGQQNVLDSQVIEMGDDYIGRKPGGSKKATAKQELDEYEKALNAIKAPQKEAAQQLNVLGQLYMNNRISLEEYNRAAERHRDLLLDLGLIGVKSMAGPIEVVDHTKGISTQSLLEKQLELKDASNPAGYEAYNAGKSQSKLAEMFGPLEDFNAYSTAFGMLAGSVTSAMDAWITGSASAGEAIKQFIAGALKGLASQMAIEALKHGAYAIGSLAFGDVRGASTHAAAAGAFGLAATAAAVAAKQMGGGAAATAASGGSGGSAGGRAGGGGGTVDKASGEKELRPITILVGDSFTQDSPRMRSIRAREAVDKALRERDE